MFPLNIWYFLNCNIINTHAHLCTKHALTNRSYASSFYHICMTETLSSRFFSQITSQEKQPNSQTSFIFLLTPSIRVILPHYTCFRYLNLNFILQATNFSQSNSNNIWCNFPPKLDNPISAHARNLHRFKVFHQVQAHNKSTYFTHS